MAKVFQFVDKPVALQWDDICNGDNIKAELENHLAQWWPKLFGYHLLKLGPLSAQINTLKCQINHHFSLSEDEQCSIQASPRHLPLQTHSIDAVLMTSLLEFESDPYQVLREVDRVVVSGGYIMLAGFNPISPMFLGKLLPKYQNQIPWSGHFFMPSRVKDWLGLLGYQIHGDERLVYHHLLSEYPSSIAWHSKLEKWLPSAGSVYLIVARKMDSPYTPIKDKHKIKSPNWTTAPTATRARIKVKKRPI
ncbi:class I SAM-dependent methyltransferase [Shewanella gaetbuli]|uniref:Class I SAM-dependent methyltransferase n=1 Tax=Shewanella gaetbuli TaxID=220752 RepID=A0A9X1ZJC5_9GAMM|nr:methyltransferase domain-containing protein [Shewanella gaetbuli]MCL1142571.1 class I SAM-dependent methyltransferase [Shewanella gaetbuli]